MFKFFNILKGKRTYAIAGLTFVLGGAQALGYEIPSFVYALLGSAGLGTLRVAVANK